MRRLFWITLGATAGVLVVRRVTAAANRYTPQGIAGRLDGAGDRFAAFADEVRAGMAEREVELRAALGLDGRHDVVDTPGAGTAAGTAGAGTHRTGGPGTAAPRPTAEPAADRPHA